jgi:PAS domain S-box-containing protein
MTSASVARTPGANREAALAAELELSQARLRRLAAHFHATMEQLPVGIAHANTDDRIAWANSTFCSMLGFSAEELTGKLFAEITYPDDIRESAIAMHQLWRGEVPSYVIEKRYIKKDGTILWARVTAAPSRNLDDSIDGAIGILEDITVRKAAEVEAERVHNELMRASHMAGMAEIASNALHNVGNVLNSLNISGTLVTEHVRSLKVETLTRVAALLQEHAGNLVTFLTEDERGQRIPEFLAQLSDHTQKCQRTTIAELESLTRNIEHIKDIVATQQTYTKFCSIAEKVDLKAVVEDSLAMNRGAFMRHGVTLIREYSAVPQITVVKHKVLQILVNLERNAKYACDATGRSDKHMTIRISSCERGVQIQVIDDGIGIAPDNIPKLFMHGFTTRKEGHGFGLHSSALAAREMGGILEAMSEGLGHGATFTLTLPLDVAEQSHG